MEHRHLVTDGSQLACYVRAYESGTADDQNSHGLLVELL
jgi:hypothetical protein